MWAFFRAMTCQPTTDVSPGSLGLYASRRRPRSGQQDEVRRPLGCHADGLVAAQAVGLCQGRRGQTVRIHHLIAALGQVAVGLLMPDEPLDTLG